jgi:hypothetical protein
MHGAKELGSKYAQLYEKGKFPCPDFLKIIILQS